MQDPPLFEFQQGGDVALRSHDVRQQPWEEGLCIADPAGGEMRSCRYRAQPSTVQWWRMRTPKCPCSCKRDLLPSRNF